MIGHLLIALALASSTFSAASLDLYVVPPNHTQRTQYQKWAHYHWVWLKNSLGNQANETALIEGYNDNQIPVGALNIDSEWATAFNNFVVDVQKFPDFKGFVDSMHDQDIKVLLWATSMVNTDDPDYQMCVDNGFLVRNSKGFVRPLKWWHGSGGLLDYTNPEAVKWWHKQMDLVLDAGVDGFKTDGTDPYIDEYILTGGALGYNDQPITYQEYSSSYYRDFLYYTRQKRSSPEANAAGVADAGLIMSRPVDCLVDGISKVCTPFSPKDVMFSGWVGDDDATFNGLRGCMRKVIYSAWMQYANFACDVGGYRGSDATKDQTQLLRSAQLNAFLPLMENGGGGEHRPWMYDNSAVTDIYRHFVIQHYRLSAYMFTNGANAIDTNTSAIHPLDYKTPSQLKEFMEDFTQTKWEKTEDSVTSVTTVKESSGSGTAGSFVDDAITSTTTTALSSREAVPQVNSKINWVFPQPTTFAYLLGQDILVHPVMYDADNHTEAARVHVTFPQLSDVIPDTPVTNTPGSIDTDSTNTVWLDWWQPTNPKKSHTAGSEEHMIVPLGSYPVFVRKGAFLPLHPTSYAKKSDKMDEEELAGELPFTQMVDTNEVQFTWFGPSTAASSGYYALRESVSDGPGMVATAAFESSSTDTTTGTTGTTGTLIGTISAHKAASTATANTAIERAGMMFVGVSEPDQVDIEAWPGSRCTHHYASITSTLTVSCANIHGGLKVTATGVTSTFDA